MAKNRRKKRSDREGDKIESWEGIVGPDTRSSALFRVIGGIGAELTDGVFILL